jgi:glycosyltransferase involved in cell wall biosynthesis
MQVLFLSRWRPYPADNGSKIRIFNMLRQLSQQHEVRLIAFDDEYQAAPAVGPLREVCASAQFVPYRTYRPYSGRALAGALAACPRFLVDTYSPRLNRLVAEAVADQRPDVIVASQLDMAPYALQVDGIPLVLEELEVSTHLESYTRGPLRLRPRSALTWYKLAAYLRRVLPRFDVCTVASLQEAANVRHAVPGYDRIVVVPNAVDLTLYSGDFGPRQPGSMVFTGAFTYAPNAEAGRFLIDEVFPLVATQVPAACLRITGRVLAETRVPGPDGIEMTGYVPDIRPVIATSAVALAPVRTGGGTRLKILEAMALRTPVVATSKAAEGLGARHDRELLLADDAGAFARSILRIMCDPALANQLSSNARALVESRYDWTSVGLQLRALVESVGQSALA